MKMDEVFSRVRTNLALKIYLSVGLTLLFVVSYLLPQRYPVFAALVLKQTWLDCSIPFKPEAIYLYESLCLLIPIAPWLMRSADRLKRYSLGLVLMDLIGGAFFLFLPTAVMRPQAIHDSNALYGLVVALDANSNAFPSLHVAYALFHCAWCQVMFCTGKRKVLRYFFWCWALGIIASTLVVKQHYVIDCIGGAVLGLGCFAVGRPFLRPGRAQERPGKAKD